MRDQLIRDRLIRFGKQLYDESRTYPLPFIASARSRLDAAEIQLANELMSDLAGHPHAFVLACVMDRQIRAERAWAIPHLIRKELGTFDFAILHILAQKTITGIFEKLRLHRFNNRMALNFRSALDLIGDKYQGRADRIWEGNPSSAEAVFRFLEFEGVGPKIATMAVNILARDFKIPFSDFYSVDVSVDVHIQRVFKRLGLVPEHATREQIVYLARAICPEFPGLLDLPAWNLGRGRCRARKPKCDSCTMEDVCSFKQSGGDQNIRPAAKPVRA